MPKMRGIKTMTEDYTSIRIRKDTKTKIEKKGKFGESHNDIIERLLE